MREKLAHGKNEKMKNKVKSKSGITLVALVVTIVVLLILAGITINILMGDNGIIKKAQEAKEKAEQDAINTQQGLANLVNEMNNAINGTGGSGSGSGTGGGETPGGSGGEDSGGETTIPEGLEVGSTVTYSPSGTYTWQAKYYSSDETKTDVSLSSASGQGFHISTWKVLSIDETTKKVELVPSAPTTETVYLGQAQGYNNGVKLLNEACSSLYGNEENPAKRITARSIKIEDIEKYMTDTAKTEVHSSSTYKKQVSSAYSIGNSKYPAIYAQEKLAVIGTSNNGETGLGLSEQSTFIERAEGTSGVITPTERIKPYHTAWSMSANDMSNAFKPIEEGNTDKGSYHSLIIPGAAATYWVASRGTYTFSYDCSFRMFHVRLGAVEGKLMCRGVGDTDHDSCALFPVVSLSSELISKDSTGYKVNLD